MTVNKNETAPDFVLPETSGKEIRLSDFRGKYVVLYFYPKDMTPGCTNEACDFRDAYEQFSDLNAVIIGISPDSVDSHKQFMDKHDLPFHLLADEDHVVASKYGVWKESGGNERSTFIINPEGNVEKVFRNVQVEGHADEALDHIKNKA